MQNTIQEEITRPKIYADDILEFWIPNLHAYINKKSINIKIDTYLDVTIKNEMIKTIVI